MGDATLEVESDSGTVLYGNQFEIRGNVQVKHGPRSISAESMQYDRDREQGKLEGNVVIRNPGILVRGDRAVFSTANSAARFEGGKFIMHKAHLRGEAGSIVQTEAGGIELRNGRVTTCEPQSNTWHIEGEKITLNPTENRGTARNVSLRIADVPVIYLPWFSFPLGDERQTGFLAPAISSSEDGGLNIAKPWYWNMAPNYDMTITPRLISGRGAMLETENRYLNRAFTSSLNLAYLASDDGGQDPDLDTLVDTGQASELQARPHRGKDRWSIQARQSGVQKNAAGWYSDINLNKVSDIDYFRDIGGQSFNQSNQTHINQIATLGYFVDNWHLQTIAQDRQILLSDVDEPYRLLPRINARGVYRYKGGFQLNAHNEYTRFTHPKRIRRNGSTIVDGSRLFLDYRVKRGWRKPWGFLVPEVGYKHLTYQLDTWDLAIESERRPSVTAGQASLDMGLIFERQDDNYLQTLEPRIFHFFREYANHDGFYNITEDGQHLNFDTSPRTFTYGQLYRDTRFSGHDRLDDAFRTTLGLRSSWYKHDDSGVPVFDAGLGKVFHHEDRRISLQGENQGRQSSELAGDITISLGPLSRFYAMGNYDTANHEMSRASAGIRYANRSQSVLFNIAWAWVRGFQQLETNSRNINQIDTSLVIPIHNQWQLMSRYNYDYDTDQVLETFLGIEFNECCYLVRALARRWLDSNIATLVDDDDLLYDQGLFLEFHLKGLGGSGARVAAIVDNGIPGYKQREQLRNTEF